MRSGTVSDLTERCIPAILLSNSLALRNTALLENKRGKNVKYDNKIREIEKKVGQKKEKNKKIKIRKRGQHLFYHVP